MAEYRGSGNVARKVILKYRGYENVARKVVKRYRSVNNVARLVMGTELVAKFYNNDPPITSNYTVSADGRTLSWNNTNSSSEIRSSWFRIERDGGFPSNLTIAYTLKQSYGAIVFCESDGIEIYYGDYSNAFSYEGGTGGIYVDLETTYDDGTADECIFLAVQSKQSGRYNGEITNLTINGEAVKFVI